MSTVIISMAHAIINSMNGGFVSWEITESGRGDHRKTKWSSTDGFCLTEISDNIVLTRSRPAHQSLAGVPQGSVLGPFLYDY